MLYLDNTTLILLTILSIIMQTSSEPDKRIITTLKYSKYRVQPTIVNGQVAGSGQVPYIVSIKEPFQSIANYKLWSNLCGGSIISASRVLTAAHCFENNHYYYYRNKDILRIIAGNMDTNIYYSGDTKNVMGTQWRSITSVKLHRHFNFPTNDIALVFVDKEWEFEGNVDYVLTARRNIDYPSVCKAAGYGRVGYGPQDRASEVLLMARINLLTRNQCSNLWQLNMNSFVCTTSAISDVSNGDSGGPLTCRDTKDPEERDGRDLLVGVVSGKNFDRTTLFTRVSAYREWIDRNTASLQSEISFVLACLSLLSTLVCNLELIGALWERIITN